VIVDRRNDETQYKALHGLTRTLVAHGHRRYEGWSKSSRSLAWVPLRDAVPGD